MGSPRQRAAQQLAPPRLPHGAAAAGWSGPVWRSRTPVWDRV